MACIDTLYTELPWKERFQAAKEDGFAAVEFWDWRDKDLKDTKEAAESAEILISGFNGDADYSLVDPEHREKYLEELKKSIEAAKKVGAFSLTIHSNALGEGGVVVKHYEELSDTVKICCMYDGLLGLRQAGRAGKYQFEPGGLEYFSGPCGEFSEYYQDGAYPCGRCSGPS